MLVCKSNGLVLSRNFSVRCRHEKNKPYTGINADLAQNGTYYAASKSEQKCNLSLSVGSELRCGSFWLDLSEVLQIYPADAARICRASTTMRCPYTVPGTAQRPFRPVMVGAMPRNEPRLRPPSVCAMSVN